MTTPVTTPAATSAARASGPPHTDPLAPRFAQWRRAGHTALIPYITAGYPDPASTDAVLDALVRAGADIIELGVPFSDPVADGPTIQRASQVALGHGVNLAWTLDALRRFRARHDTPVVLFSYLNPILAFGVERFLAEATAAGAHGILLTDLPVGADDAMESMFEDSELALIRLVAPTTPRERLERIAECAQGFIYYVARLGVTGAGLDLRAELTQELTALRAMTAVPVAVGFGVSTPEHAATLAGAADGVIVGSALIDALDRGGIPAAEQLIASMRAALPDR